MKATALLFLSVTLTTTGSHGQAPQEIIQSEPVEISRGPNQRTLETTKQVPLGNGEFRAEKSLTVEISAGLSYTDPQTGSLLPSRALISPHQFGAIAHQGQIKCAFSSDLKTRGAIQMGLDDGTLLSCNILGLGWVDSATGNAIMLAETKSCTGVIDSENTITWVDAMDGLRCSVRVTYHTWGVESDLILLEGPNATPEDYGMSSATTRWELYTEFNDPPAPSVRQVPIATVLSPDAQAPAALGKFSDVILDFSSLRFGEGKAFDLQGTTPALPVGKTWTRTGDNRLVLIEQIEYPAIMGAIATLPKAQAALKRSQQKLRAGNVLREPIGRNFPPPMKKAEQQLIRPMTKSIQTAQIGKEIPAFLWDYVVTLNSGITNYVFRGDATYSITGPVTLYSTSHISGGAVIKFGKNANAYLDFNGGTVVCDTTPYYPAIFTSSQDQTMGSAVVAGSISGYYATIPRWCPASPSSRAVQHA